MSGTRREEGLTVEEIETCPYCRKLPDVEGGRWRSAVSHRCKSADVDAHTDWLEMPEAVAQWNQMVARWKAGDETKGRFSVNVRKSFLYSFECSSCGWSMFDGNDYYGEADFNYCPNCGLKVLKDSDL